VPRTLVAASNAKRRVLECPVCIEVAANQNRMTNSYSIELLYNSQFDPIVVSRRS
jgi:hypothetical protein